MNEYTNLVESLTERTRAGELLWYATRIRDVDQYLHADKTLALFYCPNFASRFYISFGMRGNEYVYEIVFSFPNDHEFISLASDELDSRFELALRELVEVVRFGKLKGIFEESVK